MNGFQDKTMEIPVADSPEHEAEISRRDLLKMASPLGMVTLEKARCTGCGLCTLDCPTGALAFLPGEETDVYQLRFKHKLCIACGQCVKICPEKCLHLERSLEMDVIKRPATVLFEDAIARCAGCGSPLASKAMIKNIKAKVLATGQAVPPTLDLCPDCKVKVQLSRPGN